MMADGNDLQELTVSEKRLRLVKTLCLVFIQVDMGYSSSVINPTIIDLKNLVGSNYEEISRILVAKSVGVMFGAVIFGALADRFRRHIELLLSCELLLLAVTLTLAPWMPNLPALGTMFFFTGISHGSLSANANALLIRMWGEKAASPLHAVFMGYGVGTLIAPVIAVPFLSTNQRASYIMATNESTPYTSTENNTSGTHIFLQRYNRFSHLDTFSRETNVTNLTDTHIHAAYGIGGSFAGLTALLFLIFFLFTTLPVVNKSKGKKNILELFNPANCSGGQAGLGVFILICIFFIYVAMVGKDMAFCTFMFPLAVETHLHFSKSMASYTVTLYFVGYTVGRFVVSFLAYFIPITILVYIEIIGNGGILLWMIAANLGNQTQFLIMATSFGIFAGPMYPGCMAWMNKNLTEMTSLSIAVIDLGVGIGTLVFPWISGYLYQYDDKMNVLYLSAGCNAILVAVLIFAQLGIRINNRNINYTELDEDSNVEIERQGSELKESSKLFNKSGHSYNSTKD